MQRVCAGASIARYGDGEFKMLHDAGIKNHDAHPVLSRRLREILLASGDCLVGIPNIRSDTPKAEFWGKFMAYGKFLAERPYVSSFVTRPDSAPWINTPDYWRLLETLWRDQDVTLVRGSGKSLTTDDVPGARDVTEIVGPKRSAFVEYDALIARIVAAKHRRVLIGLGPVATVMAVDLCAKGFHAIDLGHLAMFLRKYRRGEDMTLSKDDKPLEASPA
jgi:hypothetical protein